MENEGSYQSRPAHAAARKQHIELFSDIEHARRAGILALLRRRRARCARAASRRRPNSKSTQPKS